MIATYIRVSSDTQDLTSQRHAVNEWLMGEGIDPEGVQSFLDEGISGAVGPEGRPGFRALLEAIGRRQITRVILPESSRVSRDYLTFLSFLQTAATNRCSVEIIGQKDPIRFESSTDKLLASIHAYLGMAEREKIRERIKRGMQARKADKSKPPLGAKRGNTLRKGKTKAYDPALVRDITALTKKGVSARVVADTLGTKYTKRPISYGTVLYIRKRIGIS